EQDAFLLLLELLITLMYYYRISRRRSNRVKLTFIYN
ncbi:MAG: hypothetical protein ACI9KI_000859, partial [Patiriisocius sp.]